MDGSSIGIVGASLAGVHAARAVRALGYTGRVVVIGDEPHLPYDRPPLSKEVLTGDYSVADTALSLEGTDGVQWRTGVAATGLDVAAREVRLADGTSERFTDGLIVATGAKAYRLPGFDLAGVHVVRTVDDGANLASDLQARPARVVIVGAGFIGCEIASVCRRLGLAVTVIEPLPTPLDRVLGTEVGRLIEAMHLETGVDFRLGCAVTGAVGDERGRVTAVRLADGESLAADVVVLAVGVKPNTDWLRDSGLNIDDGIVCDETGQAADGIVAAGDVARWPSRRRETTIRIEHWDNAIRQGAHAARRILAGAEGANLIYDPVPWFWSDQAGRKLQMLGSTRGYDEVLVVPDERGNHRALAVYGRKGRLAAVLGVNRAKQMVMFRRLMEADASWDDAVAHVKEMATA